MSERASSFAERERLAAELKAFGIAVNRKINIRRGDFKPHTNQERDWAREGPVKISDLYNVKQAD